jgi:hypothetical protein
VPSIDGIVLDEADRVFASLADPCVLDTIEEALARDGS